MNHDRVIGVVKIRLFPDAFIYVLNRKDFVPVLHQQLEDLILDIRHADQVSILVHFIKLQAHAEASDLQAALPGLCLLLAAIFLIAP